MRRVHVMSREQSRAVHLDLVFDDPERLSVERVSAAVPHEELTVRNVQERRSFAETPTRAERDLLSERARVVECGLRHVATRTRYLARFTLPAERIFAAVVVTVEELSREAGVEEQALTKFRSGRIVRPIVRDVRGRGRKGIGRQGKEQSPLLLRHSG